MITTSRLPRRRALKLGAAALAGPLVHIRTAGAAGKLNVGPWDHWVPAGNAVMRKQMLDWADKNKVELNIDFITNIGGKRVITANGEAQAKTGHDMLSLSAWEAAPFTDLLEPVNDIMDRLTKQYGPTNAVFEYLGKTGDRWFALPTSWGTQNKSPCGRISMLKDIAGLDVLAMYPARDERTEASKLWTMDAQLKAAEACHKAGVPFGIGIGTTGDSVDTIGGFFSTFGAELVDAKGQPQVKSDAVRQALDYCARLAKFLPDNTISYDDTSNNKALIAGKSALIYNPPSAWAVAKRDAPDVAADCWTFPAPVGPAGRCMPVVPNFFTIWKFAPNRSAAKDLIEHLSHRDLVRERITAVDGYDNPPFATMTDFPIWGEVGPPTGTVFHYPIRPIHDTTPMVSGFPAPPEIGVKMYQRGTMTSMVARLHTGQKMQDVLSWAENEIEGFTR